MYSVSQRFRDALEASAKQHIHGMIYLPDGTRISLNSAGNGENILGCPSITTQIVSDTETFNISELYIGTLDIEVMLRSSYQLRGAQIELSVSIDGASDDVPMGMWDIRDTRKQPSGAVAITAYDQLARLDVPLPDDEGTGIIQFGTLFSLIEGTANVRFAQTLAELQELCPDVWLDSIYPMSFRYAPTCRLEVQYMAQYLGCYVIANRQGEIEFRRYSQDVKAYIPAEKRFSASLSDTPFFVQGFCYTDKYGRTVESLAAPMGSSSSKIFLPQENVFIADQAGENAESYYKRILDPLKNEFALAGWYTGAIDYYGDPTLDVGDRIALTGGAAGAPKTFLICSNTWQYRSPQTLISGGAPRVGDSVTSSGGSGGSVYSSTVINTTKNIVTVSMTVYTDMLIGVPRTAARGAFKAKESTVIFVTFTLVMLGNADSTAVKAAVYIDDDIIGVKPAVSLDEDRTATLSFAFPVTVSGGEHTVRVTAENYGEIVSAAAEVSGQSITAGALTYDETDYEYTLTADSAAVTGYSGGVNAEIPEVLGGKPVTVIASGAFSGDVETVYIPEGTEVIE